MGKILFIVVVLFGLVVRADELLHLPGIGGHLMVDDWFVEGIRAGGYKGGVRIFDWTAGDPGVNALHARQRNDKEAEKVAQLLSDMADKCKRNGGQVVMTAHSGGAAIAVWALEKLPKNVKISRLVMMAPALSPGYDLSAALAHVSDSAIAYVSPYDTIVLGAGTRLFGTMDGVHIAAAGQVGFIVPDKPAVGGQYGKLRQEIYRPEWLDLGNLGDHIGWMMPTFVERVIAVEIMGH